jgi:3-oxoacyl-[acyl-carrier-protein] synthase II
MKPLLPRRVAVTGLGIISGLGGSVPAFSEGLFSGRCGIRPVSLFDTSGYPCRSAAEVDPVEYETLSRPVKARRISRCDVLGLIAADEAVKDSGIDRAHPDWRRTGVVLGGGAGGMLSWERFRRTLWSGNGRPRPSLVLAASPCTLTDLVASRFGLRGFRSTITTACSSSATSIGYGFDLIRAGQQDIVIAGGSESLCELTFAGFSSLKVMAPDFCRPFDRNRKGLTLGEGAAILILEEYRHAEERGARIYAEVLGYAINADAYHMTSPDPDAAGMQRVMIGALTAAGVRVEQLSYINAHGTGTKVNDQMEAVAIRGALGRAAGRLVVSSTKSMTGHCLGAAGSIEAVATILALHVQTVPPTIHLEEPDPECGLDFVPNLARKQPIDFAISNSFAFGGNNTCLAFGRHRGKY